MSTTKEQKQRLYKAKRKLDKAQALYDSIRQEISDGMSNGESNTLSVAGQTMVMTKTQRASITKAEIIHFKCTMKKKKFNALFTTSYSLPITKYNSLTDGKLKSKLAKHVKILDCPLSVTLREE